MALEPIKRLVFADPDKMLVQSDAIASAETWTERHIGRYRALEGAFGGRYIAADLFKETFAEYAAGRDGRARYKRRCTQRIGRSFSRAVPARPWGRAIARPGQCF